MSRRYIPIRVRRNRTQSWFRKFKNYTALGGSPGVAQLLPDRDSDFWEGYTVPVPDYLSTLSMASGNLSLLGGSGIDFTAGGNWLYQRKCVGLMDENRAWSPVAGIETTKTATSFVGGANDLEPSQSWVCVAILRSLNDLGVDRIFKKYADGGSGQTGNCFYRDGTTIKHRAYFEGDFVESEVTNAVSRDYSLVAGLLDARDERVGVAVGASTDWNDTSFGDSDLSNTGNATLFENWNELAGTHYVWIGFWLGTDAEDMIDNWSDFVDNFWKHGQINDLTVDADNTVLIPAQGTDGGLAAVTTDRPRLGADGLIIHSARTMNPLRSLLDSGKWSRRAVAVDRQAADGPDGLRSVITLTEEEDNNTFSLIDENELPGVERLDPYLNINGQTIKPDLRFNLKYANNASLDPYGFGKSLIYQAGTAPDFNAGCPFYGLSDSVKFNGAFYLSDDNTFGDIDLEDYIWEFIIKMPLTGDNETFVHKKDGGSEGWQLSTRDDYKVRFNVEDSLSNVWSIESAAKVPGSYCHYFMGVNQDEDSSYGVRLFANGVHESSQNPVAVGSLSNSALFSIGSTNTGLATFTGNIVYVCMWKKADLIQAGEAGYWELRSIAQERSAKLWGQHPVVAHGNSVPTTKTRSCAAFTEKVESGYIKLYQVGSEALRTVHRKDKNGVDVYGFFPEQPCTNLIIHSENFEAWTLLDAGDTVNNGVSLGPNDEMQAGEIKCDSSVLHGLTLDATLAENTYTFSVWLKPGNKTWARLWSSSIADVQCYFDFDNGAVGTEAGTTIGGIVGPYKNGYYRCRITFESTVGIKTMRFGPVDGDGSPNLTGGDGSTTNMYFFGAQCELGNMTSYVPTDGGTATRLADKLDFVGGDNIGGESNGAGTILSNVLFDECLNDLDCHVCAISDGGVSADYIRMLCYGTNDFLYGTSACSGGNSGISNKVSILHDNVKSELGLMYEQNNMYVRQDGSLDGTPDTSVDIPDELDKLSIGQRYDGFQQLSGLMDLKIYSNIIGETPEVEHSIRETITVENSTLYTVFVVAKAFGSGAGRGTSWGRLLRLEVDLATDRWAEFDLEEGTVSDDSGDEIGYCVDLGDDWYLTALTFETEGADAGDVDLIIRLEDDNESTTYAGQDGVGVYLSEVAMMEGDFALLSANNPTEETALAKIDCDLADSTLIEKLSKDASELIIDFTLSAPLYTGGAIFTVYENATNYITFSIGLIVA